MSGVGLGAVSVLSGPVEVATPDASALDVPAGSEFNQSREDVAAQLPAPDAAPQAGGDAPQVGSTAPDDLSTLDADATQPSARPQLGAAEGDLSAPQVPAEDSGLIFEGAAPDLGETASSPQAPEAQAEADTASISTDPAQPVVPEPESEAAAFPEETPAPAPEPAAEQTPEPEADTAPDPEEAASTIGNLATGVATNRLPSVTDTPAEPEAGLDSEGDDSPPPSEALPAITAHAQPFDNPEGKPLMAVILIDDGSSPIGLDALAAFPYPLNFAVDASAPGARDAMRRYRDAGFEVLAVADLPEGAQAVDTEITMQTVLSAVPEAVAIIEGTGTGLQISRDASEQLAPILLESGHGLVLFPNGLDTARKLIGREGVPVATVFRDFDSKGQSATVIRRFLDQAAFKAGREEGGVIMLGRLRADTISALLLWGLQDRASQVSLAPISAVLRDGQ